MESRKPHHPSCQFAVDRILNIENFKESITKLLELINEFIEASGYKFNEWKLAAFYTTVMNYLKEKLRRQPHFQQLSAGNDMDKKQPLHTVCHNIC